MNAFATQGIQIDSQGCCERLALTGTHLGNLALVQGNTAHHLHIKVPHLHDTLRAFSDHRKRLGQKGVQRLAISEALFELDGFMSQGLVAQRFIAGL